MVYILVTGTPGAGKTKVSREIAKKYNLKYIDVNKLIKENKLYGGYDKKLKSYIVDVSKLNKFLIKYTKEFKDVVIDSHLSHYLDKKYVDLCVVVKCNVMVLEKRLKKRGYSSLKIQENLDAEIFEVCLNEARENGHKVKIIDTSKGLKKKDLEIFKK